MEEQDAFNAIKTAAKSSVCLGLIDFVNNHNEWFSYTDASKIGLYSTLIVRNMDGNCPVLFHRQN